MAHRPLGDIDVVALEGLCRQPDEVPGVLRGGLYAVPALLGAAIVVVGSEAGSHSIAFPLLGMLVCFGVRVVALRRDINPPRDTPQHR